MIPCLTYSLPVRSTLNFDVSTGSDQGLSFQAPHIIVYHRLVWLQPHLGPNLNEGRSLTPVTRVKTSIPQMINPSTPSLQRLCLPSGIFAAFRMFVRSIRCRSPKKSIENQWKMLVIHPQNCTGWFWRASPLRTPSGCSQTRVGSEG